MIRGVLWDFGGVITTSPFEAFARFEQANGLPVDFIRGINAINPETNAWAQLERSVIGVEEFDDKFAEESEAQGHRVRGADILPLLSGDLRPKMVHALKTIKQHLPIGCITNNITTGEGAAMSRDHDRALQMQEVFGLFDILIESSKVGIRKPDPAIYLLACEQLNVEPGQAVFLDDLGVNLKPARKLGMETIKVLNAEQALADLQALLPFRINAA